jgi:hypothetical protein
MSALPLVMPFRLGGLTLRLELALGVNLWLWPQRLKCRLAQRHGLSIEPVVRVRRFMTRLTEGQEVAIGFSSDVLIGQMV